MSAEAGRRRGGGGGGAEAEAGRRGRTLRARASWQPRRDLVSGGTGPGAAARGEVAALIVRRVECGPEMRGSVRPGSWPGGRDGAADCAEHGGGGAGCAAPGIRGDPSGSVVC